MAQSVEIVTKGNAAKIIVDGNEIYGVISYTLSVDNENGAVLHLSIGVMGGVEVRNNAI